MTVYVDTIGFELNLTVIDEDTEAAIDVSSGLGTLTLNVEKPDESVVVWTPTVTNGPAGTAQYKTVAGDLDQVGTYTIQGHWNPTDAGEDFFSETLLLTVRDRVPQ